MPARMMVYSVNLKERSVGMKRFFSVFLLVLLLFTAACAETASEELNAGMTFADVQDEKPLVVGPKMTREFIENYIRENPDILWEIPEYLDVFNVVQTFTEIYPEAENYSPDGKVL